jgi:hypothetical protein
MVFGTCPPYWKAETRGGISKNFSGIFQAVARVRGRLAATSPAVPTTVRDATKLAQSGVRTGLHAPYESPRHANALLTAIANSIARRAIDLSCRCVCVSSCISTYIPVQYFRTCNTRVRRGTHPLEPARRRARTLSRSTRTSGRCCRMSRRTFDSSGSHDGTHVHALGTELAAVYAAVILGEVSVSI